MKNTMAEYLKTMTDYGFVIAYEESFIRRGQNETMYVLAHIELGILIVCDTYTHNDHIGINSGYMYYNWSPNEFKATIGCVSSGSFLLRELGKHVTLFEPDMITEYHIESYPPTPKWDLISEYGEYSKLSDVISEEQNNLIDGALANGKRCLWSGYHDIRSMSTRLIDTIKLMKKKGKFFPIWQDSPLHWICTSSELMSHKSVYPYTELYRATHNRIDKMPDYVKTIINGTYKR